MSDYDALVIGAGLIGLATAYHIKRERPQDNVLVIDMKNAAGQGDTAKSGLMFRTFFHSKTNLLLADTSIEFYRHIQRNLKRDLKMKWTGYLFLFSHKDELKQAWVKGALRAMDERGLEYKVYNSKELIEKLNVKRDVEKDEEARMMGLVNVDYGVLIPKAGSIDVSRLVEFYESEFIKLGGKVEYNNRAHKILLRPKKPLEIPGEPHFWQESRVAGTYTDKGIRKAKKTLIATGAWINELLDPLGINSYVKPWRAQVFVLKAESRGLKKLLFTPGFNLEGCMPFTILPQGIYINPRPEENAFWTGYDDIIFGRAFEFEEEPRPEERFYRYSIYPILTKYFPQFLNVYPFTSWAGRLDINTIDKQPIIFEKNDLIVITGLSGNGIMKADAVGRVAAALYMDKKYAELYRGERVKITNFGIEERSLEPETFALI